MTIALGATGPLAQLRAQLGGNGHILLSYTSTTALLRGLHTREPDVLLIDARSPAIDWRAFVERNRNWRNPTLPVVLLGARDPGAVEALAAGADDFVSVDAAEGELLARVRAASLRRRPAAADTCSLRCGDVRLQLQTSSIAASRGAEALTARELALARLLFDNAGQVVSRRRLAHSVWGCDEELASRSIEQHVYQLRRKLKRCAGDQVALRGVYGTGYQLDAVTAGKLPCGPS